MNIKFKDSSNTQVQRRMQNIHPRVPSSQSFNSESLINTYQERPLKYDIQNLSFKGLSTFMYKPTNEIPYSAQEVINMTKKTLGSSVEKLYNHVKDSEFTKKLVHIDGDKVIFHKMTIPHLILNAMMYPFKILPGDILNGAVNLLKKVKPFKNWAEETLESSFFKKIRQRSKVESQVSSLRGIFETAYKFKKENAAEETISSKLFEQSVKMFDPKTGNYDTKHERSLNRIVSGSIPAFFLANDAYNLSMMCNDNKEEAKKEQKTRFKQEVSRVGVTAYLTLITMGALQKHVNNSKFGVMLMTGSTVLFTEMFSRLTNGKHIEMLTPEKAKKINAKNKKSMENKENDKTKEDEYKNVFFKSDGKELKNNKVNTTKFKGNETSDNQKKQKPLLSFAVVMKACAISLAACFGFKGLRKIKAFDEVVVKVQKPFQNAYKKLTVEKDVVLEDKKLNQILDKLKENGFEELANKYKEIADKARTGDNLIHLGEKDKKWKPAVDFVITPFKFAADALTLPYNLAMKIYKSIKKTPPKAPTSVDLTKAQITSLAKSIDKIGHEALKKNYSPEKFQSFVNDNIMKAFNVDTMSNISNSELANLAKTSATAATLWFLMADNHNMVMLKSNGEDKDGAKLKAKERFVQEMSRLFYQTLLISLFNNTFRTQYNGSLWGMSWVTASNTVIGEILNRKSIGMPAKKYSREELLENEKRKENATGFTKSYYNFMARLTGKKSLSEIHKEKTTTTTK